MTSIDRLPYSVEGLARRFVAAAPAAIGGERHLTDLVNTTTGIASVPRQYREALAETMRAAFVDMARREPQTAFHVEMMQDALELACLWGWRDGAEIDQSASPLALA